MTAPHVMPIGMYRVDEATNAIDTLGRELTTTKKWRDVLRSGRAEVIDGPEPVIRIHPERIVRAGMVMPVSAAESGR